MFLKLLCFCYKNINNLIRVLRTFSMCMFVEDNFCKYLNIHLILYFQLTSQKMVKIYWRKYIS